MVIWEKSIYMCMFDWGKWITRDRLTCHTRSISLHRVNTCSVLRSIAFVGGYLYAVCTVAAFPSFKCINCFTISMTTLNHWPIHSSSLLEVTDKTSTHYTQPKLLKLELIMKTLFWFISTHNNSRAAHTPKTAVATNTTPWWWIACYCSITSHGMITTIWVSCMDRQYILAQKCAKMHHVRMCEEYLMIHLPGSPQTLTL